MAASAFAWRTTVNADGAADAADVESGRRVELAALAAAVRTAVAAGVRIVGMVVQPGGTDPAAVAVAGGVAIDAPILRLWLEETDSLGAWVGHGDARITAIYRVASRFFGQKRA
jgi:hypothetical protein